MRAIVTVAVGNRPDLGKPNEQTIVGIPFAAMLERWRGGFEKHGEGAFIRMFTELPPGSPEHLHVPYAFKAYAIQAMLGLGFSSILWADAAVVAIRSLVPIWERTERLGYWFSKIAIGTAVSGHVMPPCPFSESPGKRHLPTHR